MQHASLLSGLKRLRATRGAASFWREVKRFLRLRNTLCLTQPRNLSVANNISQSRRTGHTIHGVQDLVQPYANTCSNQILCGLKVQPDHEQVAIRRIQPVAVGRGPSSESLFLPRSLRLRRQKVRGQSISHPQANRMPMKMPIWRNKARSTGRDQIEVAMLSSRQGRSRGPARKPVDVVVVDFHGTEASADVEPAERACTIMYSYFQRCSIS